MINKSNSIIKGILLIATVVTLSSCVKTENIKWGIIKGVSVKKVNLSGVEIEATVPIENRNSGTLVIKQGDLMVSADANQIAHIKQVNDVVVPGNSSADYKVNIDIDLVNKGGVLSIMSLVNSQSSFNVDGTIKARSFIFQKTIQVHQNNIQDYVKPIINKMNLF